MNKKAFTLMEVIVASVIFTLVLLGLLGIFSAGNMHVVHSRERMTSGELGKLFVDPFQNAVRQDTWDSNTLNVTTTPVTGSETRNGRVFTSSTEIVAITGEPDVRRVVTTITWDEPAATP